MPICPRSLCYGTLDPYSDPGESWKIHLMFVGTIVDKIESMTTGIRMTDILLCSQCKAYGYVCPYCSTAHTEDNNLGHGTKRVCSSCRERFILVNPSNLLSAQ